MEPNSLTDGSMASSFRLASRWEDGWVHQNPVQATFVPEFFFLIQFFDA